MKNILIGCFLLATSFGIGQEKILEGWTINDKAQYAKLKQLANYVHKKHPSEISKDSLFKNYIYLDHVLTDTVTERRDR